MRVRPFSGRRAQQHLPGATSILELMAVSLETGPQAVLARAHTCDMAMFSHFRTTDAYIAITPRTPHGERSKGTEYAGNGIYFRPILYPCWFRASQQSVWG